MKKKDNNALKNSKFNYNLEKLIFNCH